MKRSRPEPIRPQITEVISPSISAPSRPHKKHQKPRSLRLSHKQIALAAITLTASLLLLLLNTSSHCYNLRPTQRLILTASHLRSSDGELRLRIITHNLKLLYEEVEKDATKQKPPLKSIVIFSHDGNESTLETIQQWKESHSTFVDEVKLVPNDAINVDVSKWMSVLETTQNSQVMLINDSFLLLRPIPELWECHGVCGLGWTAPVNDVSRHIQSYLRVLTSCEIEHYKSFYQSHSHSKNVQELIQSLEVNLSWATNVQALYEYQGGHPDEEAVQKQLLAKGYPAIKLKKFFETKDPWFTLKRNGSGEQQESSSSIPPSLDLQVYRSKNHDLNHLSDQELENHFISFGWKENRIYSKLPLVIKSWLKDELSTLSHGEEVLSILMDYLASLNKGNESTELS